MSELQKPSLCVSRARHLSACLFHVSASGAIIAAATANSRRLSQQNPYKTCVSLVELGQTSRHFLVHFEKIPTKIILRYGRCAKTGSDPIPRDVFLGIKLLGCFPRGYFVLLGIRGIFELLKQVISPCPKTYRSLRYEYEYQHCIKNPNTVLLVRPICPEM